MILQGDCLKKLKEIPDNSVDCCITSPPYWGLRDYGTAKWEGGDKDCDHQGKPMATRTNIHDRTQPQCNNQPDENVFEIYREVCGKCGAKRVDDQMGLEQTPDEYVENMVKVFREVKRVLKAEGTLWLNLGDSYAGSGGWEGCKNNSSLSNSNLDQKAKDWKSISRAAPNLKSKDLVGIPWRVAFALQADGWYLRQDIIWYKPNPMPESVTDRCTKTHEYIFLLTKNPNYYYDNEAIKENSVDPESYTGRKKRNAPTMAKYDLKNLKNAGSIQEDGTLTYGQIYEKRNKRSVWTVTTKPFKEAHFATFPEDLITPCLLAGTSAKGVCPDCGKPWQRVLEKGQLTNERSQREDTLNVVPGRDKLCRLNSVDMEAIPKKTIGWEPTCQCGKQPVPATVLDPFFGAGTTGVVAKKSKRNYIGIELNPKYIEIAEKRIKNLPERLFSAGER
jgi:DNA modification methylase